jgi:hypothetical protein
MIETIDNCIVIHALQEYKSADVSVLNEIGMVDDSLA